MKKSLLCLSVTESTLKENLNIINRYRGKIDIVELRADFMNKSGYSGIHGFPDSAGLPVILTLRRKVDGGRFTGTEGERRKILLAGLKGNYSYIDLEHDNSDNVIEKTVKTSKITVIRSIHDFTGVPDNIAAVVSRISRNSREIAKAALLPRNSKDFLRLLQAYEELKGIRKILVGMGDYGVPTRILAGKLGSFISYTSKNKGGAAPGHIPVDDMAGLYRFSMVTEKTSVYGVAGNPVMHTSSPVIHNMGYIKLGLDAVYVPFLVDNLDSFMKAVRLLGVKGISVTIPHKETVIPFLCGTDESVKSIGACNTVFLKGGKFYGTNTDAEGFLKPLMRMFAGNIPEGLKATVIGAGGAARSAVYALVKKGIDVLILNRTAERAEKLAAEMGCSWSGTGQGSALETADRVKDYSDIIVQATRVGMEPDIHGDPLPGYSFTGKEIVYDMVYKPKETVFLKRALKAGCRVVYGIDMLIEQAKVQFKIFTNRDFPFRHFEL
ncbi:MAG: shikimate dehydrogenase [Spirochaetes bacterium]|nr:shikimate dehydrogenase [Spirochaetota bacterium]